MGDGERVLIVDNDAQVRHCLEYAFDSYGYVVRTCSDGHEPLPGVLATMMYPA